MRSGTDRLKTRGRTLNFAAPVYDFVVDRLSLGQEGKVRDRFLELASFAEARNVLDVGCATGSLTVRIAERLSDGGRVVGIDAAPRMVQRASEKVGGLPVRFDVQLAEDLDFPDSSFDTVVNTMFFHHLPIDLKERALAEMFRVLQPGGRLFTVDVDRPTTLFGAAVGYASFVLLIQKPIYENLRGVLPQLMRAAGFTDVDCMDHTHGFISFFSAARP